MLVMMPESHAIDNYTDSIILQFKTSAEAWEATFLTLAKRLFWLLAGIQFTYSLIKLLLEKADLQALLVVVIRQILFIGFFYFILTQGASIITVIIDSFKGAGDQASIAAGAQAGMSPTDVLEYGLEIFSDLMKHLNITDIGGNIAIVLGAFVILLNMVIVSAQAAIVIIESYLVTYIGVLFLGFGGSTWTKSLTENTLKMAVGIGTKILVMQMLLSVGQQFMSSWVITPNAFGGLSSNIPGVTQPVVERDTIFDGIPRDENGLIIETSPEYQDVLTAPAQGGALPLSRTTEEMVVIIASSLLFAILVTTVPAMARNLIMANSFDIGGNVSIAGGQQSVQNAMSMVLQTSAISKLIKSMVQPEKGSSASSKAAPSSNSNSNQGNGSSGSGSGDSSKGKSGQGDSNTGDLAPRNPKASPLNSSGAHNASSSGYRSESKQQTSDNKNNEGFFS